MWNHIALKYGISLWSAMVITDPKNLESILNILVKNNKYIWWWLGVWFKDSGYEILKKSEFGFVQPVADAMQSINFVAHFWDEIHGANSDASGYVESLDDMLKQNNTSLEGKNIVLLWAWGTTRGIALELALRGVEKITLYNRTVEKAQHIAENVNGQKPWVAFFAWENEIKNILKDSVDVVINLTTKWADGKFEAYSWMTPITSPEENLKSSKEILEQLYLKNKNIIISDINLTKSSTTPLLEQAKEVGLQTLDGKAMVVYQWVEAIWTVFGDKIIEKWGSKDEVKQEQMQLILKK